jgi:uncharacterized protein YuzE
LEREVGQVTISLDVDLSAGAAYIRLSEGTPARTVEVDDAIMIDVDEFNVVVGIEVLDLRVDLPFALLTDRFHVHTDVIEELRIIQPSVHGFLSLKMQSEGATHTLPLTVAR